MQTPILGLIENMSYSACPDTAGRHEIFGPSHAKQTVLRLGVAFPGRLPIDSKVARLCDAGRIEDYGSEAFTPIAEELVLGAPEMRRSTLMQGHAGQ
jgi:hypothetical protein